MSFLRNNTASLTDVQVAMKVFVDNFAVLGVEHCFLNMLPEMFSLDVVMGLDEDLTKRHCCRNKRFTE